MPILQQRCNDCHKAPYEENGRTKNPKAGLRFDTYDWLMKGSQDIGPIIEAGDTDASILFEVITLPPDDDMIMPPKAIPSLQNKSIYSEDGYRKELQKKPSGKVAPKAVVKTSSSEETKDDSNKDDKIHKAPPKKKTNIPSRIVFRSCSCSSWSKSR